MARLPLVLAVWDYDRTQPLLDGRVTPEGIDLNAIPLVVEETFFRMLRHREFDAAEMSLSSYVVSLGRGAPFVAIPAFPSRFFRHSGIYVHAGAGIREPRDLIGRRVGSPEYQMTAPVWIRGILAERHGLAVDAYTHVTGGQESPNRDEKISLGLPPRFRVERIGPEDRLAAMLAEGRIDALVTARKPSTYDGRRVLRLFPDFQSVERDYWRDTGIFPIMHVVAIRREIYETNRWVARSLLKAFEEAQRIAYAALRETAALKVMLPWAHAAQEEVEALMGSDFWPYGLARNLHVLETFLRYHHQQGLSDALRAPADLFAPEALEEFVI
jgi:4,5-dihydroxyphthalate decarboxylase